ncbi:membrane fusion protein (multidrug efflux system) [Peteryoungia aggregata LMG 23059]|uniref:Membrane fusion protein (Multidrug efflux system) n=1 Tax=Peteryoungia aggregata LMG 23059 TaxID=1368425 RepID=A0ABU0G383_9HYPH|nr:HlyD family secretion protein [Peteryoungia aggregata]MDQ0419182.1 membrane fusion protein (multidrug efflux system) [Peteryoungia aggregata LMG 23059]
MSVTQRSTALSSTSTPVDRNEAAPLTETDAGAQSPPAEALVADKAKKRNSVFPILVAALLGGAAWYGYGWWTEGRFMVSTEDAYIEGDIAIISPKVSGYVEKVNVTSDQIVHAGDPLVTLDGGDYQIAYEQALASKESAELSVKRIDAQIIGGEASVAQSEAQLGALDAAVRGAEITANRAGELASKSVGTAADLDNAKVALDQARANVVAGQAAVSSAQANLALLKAQREEALSAVRLQQLAIDKAKRDLDFTVLKAPYDGVIGNLSVQAGDLVSAGKRLAALVPTNELYIEANFKETQIADLVPGSKVSIHVDAYGDQPLEGTVTSIAPASGAIFSMLPAENATGNFTKVVQRVPVRIALPKDALAGGHLRAGLSVIVDVDTRTAPEGQALAAQ